MKIEKEILQFAPDFRPANAKLSSLQQQYLSVMMNNSSIEGTVQFFLKQGWLVSFRELYNLTETLVKTSAIRNANLVSYFEKLAPQDEASFFKSLLPFSSKPKAEVNLSSFKDMPFFRSLEPKLSEYLLKDAKVITVPARTFICRKGDKDRDLFVLLKGQAGVYKTNSANQRQLVANLSENSVFGEASFLLGEPRSADIATFGDCEILKVPCHPEIFSQFVDKTKAQGLQFRFWVQHALQNSSLFKDFPADCLDALSFSGRLVKLPAQHLLFREGDRGQTAYILVQGSLTVIQKGKTINVMNQGAFFGEISLIVSQGLRTASMQSQQDSLLIEIQQTEFYQLLAQNLYLAKELETLAHERLLRDQQR